MRISVAIFRDSRDSLAAGFLLNIFYLPAIWPKQTLTVQERYAAVIGFGACFIMVGAHPFCSNDGETQVNKKGQIVVIDVYISF